MKLLVVSDSHGNESWLKRALIRHADVDAVLHLGDYEGGREYILELVRTTTLKGEKVPVYMVAGNCDSLRPGGPPAEMTLDMEGHRLFLTHGHRYDVYYDGGNRLALKAEELQCDIVCFGHIHEPVTRLLPGRKPGESEMLIINPGSISRPRQDDRRQTYMLLELEEGQRPAVSLQYF